MLLTASGQFIRKCPGFFVVLDLDPRGFCFTSKDLEAPETKGILAEFGNTIVSVVDGTDVEVCAHGERFATGAYTITASGNR